MGLELSCQNYSLTLVLRDFFDRRMNTLKDFTDYSFHQNSFFKHIYQSSVFTKQVILAHKSNIAIC